MYLYPHDITQQEYKEILHAILNIYRDCNVAAFPLDVGSILKHYGFRIYSYSTLRELNEEVGAAAARWTELGSIIASPGCYAEVLYLYMAEGLTFSRQHLDEDEFLEVRIFPFAEAVEKCMSGEIRDGKTVTAVLKARLLQEKTCTL